MNVLTTHNIVLILKNLFMTLIVAGFLFFYFSNKALTKGEEKQLQEQNSQSANQDRSDEPNLAKAESKLEKTKAAFKEAFNNKGNESDMLRALIREADEREKTWIREAIINRFNSESNPRIRRVCLLSIGMFRDVARKLLAQALISDDDRGVRRLAAYMLGQRGTEEEVNALFKAVKEDKGVIGQGRNIAMVAIGALGEIGGEKAAEVLNEIWKSEELSKDCRSQTLSAMGMTGDTNVLKTLKDVLHGDDQQIRDSAAYGLGQLAWKNQESSQLVNDVAKLLRGYINDKNIRVKINTIRALGWIGKHEDIQLLEMFLEDENTTTVSYSEDGEIKTKTAYPVRDAARGAIDRINTRLPAEESVSISVSSLHEEHPVTDANEVVKSSLPTLAYVLVPCVIVFIMICVGLLLAKKKAISQSK